MDRCRTLPEQDLRDGMTLATAVLMLSQRMVLGDVTNDGKDLLQSKKAKHSKFCAGRTCAKRKWRKGNSSPNEMAFLITIMKHLHFTEIELRLPRVDDAVLENDCALFFYAAADLFNDTRYRANGYG